jgi:hypothetical protein
MHQRRTNICNLIFMLRAREWYVPKWRFNTGINKSVQNSREPEIQRRFHMCWRSTFWEGISNAETCWGCRADRLVCLGQPNNQQWRHFVWNKHHSWKWAVQEWLKAQMTMLYPVGSKRLLDFLEQTQWKTKWLVKKIIYYYFLLFNWTPNGFLPGGSGTAIRQPTKIHISHKIIHHTQTRHSSQSYTND